MRTNDISIDLLTKTIQESISWSDAMRKLGKFPRGSSFQFFQARVKKEKIDTSHFLGKAAHAGPRQTGICKKKHWSEVLIKRKTNDREGSKQLRRSFKEYCEENKIEIKCFDCLNDGKWMNKLLPLEIDHKDECRWNNEPNNLRWLCPNCHSIKNIKAEG